MASRTEPGYYSGEVVGVQVYKSDVRVIRKGVSPTVERAPRGEVTEFSRRSRQRLAFVASNTPIEFRTMITLTYPKEFPSDGRKVKRDLKAFLEWLKRDMGKFSCLWFLEFQQRGAPHVHILLDVAIPRRSELRRGMRFRVSSSWYRIVDSGDVNHLSAGTKTETIRERDGARRYAVKYAMKMRQKVVPPGYRNVGRFWGCTRDVPPTETQTIRCTEDDIRAVLDGWQYAPKDAQPLWSILYNQGDRFRDHLEKDSGQ